MASLLAVFLKRMKPMVLKTIFLCLLAMMESEIRVPRGKNIVSGKQMINDDYLKKTKNHRKQCVRIQ
jgi:hypothetical protein